MDAGSFDKLHDAWDEDVDAIADRINLDFLADDVFVNEDWFVFIDFDSGLEVVLQAVLVIDDLHGSATENEGWPNKDWISDSRSGFDAFWDRGDSGSVWLRDVKGFANLLKEVSVFGFVDGFAIGSDDLNATSSERVR